LAVNIEALDRNLFLTLSEGYDTLSKLYRKLISKICKKDSPTITVGQHDGNILGGSQNTSGTPPVSKIKVNKVEIPSS